jgi:anti-sigma regulatory factor (Ser/Thr protein kinase)
MGSAAPPGGAGTGAATLDRAATTARFRHEALFYRDDDEFLGAALPFVEAGQDAGEPVLVMVGPTRLDALRRQLDRERGAVQLVDVTAVGENPARIIPAWRNFVADHPSVRLRGIGEPFWPGRSAAEVVECHRHEALLNVALDDADLWLLCPYDVAHLAAPVLNGAPKHHPFVRDHGRTTTSASFPGASALAGPCTEPLGGVPAGAPWFGFDGDSVREVRTFVATHASAAGLVGERAADLVLAVHEVATNSVRHGGGAGELTIWRDGDTVLCEVQDTGCIADPHADRTAPTLESESGRGLWLANCLCDLVQLRSFPGRTVVRLLRRRR